MSRELFSYDPETKMSIYFDYDELTDTTSLEYVQDTAPILEINKTLSNNPDYTNSGIKQEMWHYGSIPVGLQIKWLVEEGLDIYDDNAWPQIYAKLNSPEYRHLKTTSKSHGTKNLRSVKTEEPKLWVPESVASDTTE